MSQSNKSLPLFTMLPPFYDRPTHVNVNVLLERIKKEFAVSIDKYSYNKWGFGNDVVIVNDKLVFRFPRTKEVAEQLKFEIDLLKFLKDKVRVRIPFYSFVSKNKDFGGYEIVSGKTLTTSLFKILSKNDKERVVNQLIGFINFFHSIKLAQFNKYQPLSRDYFVEIEKRIEKELAEKLFPKLSKKEVETIKTFYQESKKYLEDIPSNCPIHGDLYFYNVIWDKEKSQTGIIDFSDYMIGDPARDFEVFFDYGLESVEMAYQKYTGPKDDHFLKRAEIYYKVHGIHTLLSSLLGAPISFNYAYKYFFKPRFPL